VCGRARHRERARATTDRPTGRADADPIAREASISPRIGPSNRTGSPCVPSRIPWIVSRRVGHTDHTGARDVPSLKPWTCARARARPHREVYPFATTRRRACSPRRRARFAPARRRDRGARASVRAARARRGIERAFDARDRRGRGVSRSRGRRGWTRSDAMRRVIDGLTMLRRA